jgi:hypothetical protein
LERAKLERDENKRKLIRNLNLTSDSEIGNITDLETELPTNLDYEKDLEFAYKNRGDWKSMKLRKEIAELSIKNANDNALPSLKVSGSYAYQGQTLISPQENFTNGTNGISSFKYHNLNANARLTYPIADTGVKAEIRDAHILQRQVAIMEDDLKKEIADEVRARIVLGGRLGGAEIARGEELKKGSIPLQTFRADVDFAREKAHMPYGDIGIKVWIYRGEVFNEKEKPARESRDKR